MGRRRIRFERDAKELADVLSINNQPKMNWAIIAGFLQAFEQAMNRSLTDFGDKAIAREHHYRTLKKLRDPRVQG